MSATIPYETLEQLVRERCARRRAEATAERLARATAGRDRPRSLRLRPSRRPGDVPGRGRVVSSPRQVAAARAETVRTPLDGIGRRACCGQEGR